ncbi:YwiC-like family protein [Gleimia hominis]|nr:YwiC-like family protein [Gleimia hominis]
MLMDNSSATQEQTPQKSSATSSPSPRAGKTTSGGSRAQQSHSGSSEVHRSSKHQSSGARKRPFKTSPAVKNGWITDQHGSWGMAFFPLIAGLILAPLSAVHILLALAWTSGFLFFGAAEKWVKFHFRTRYRKSTTTYAIITGLLGIPLLIARPTLVSWALVYIPLVAIAAITAWQRKERGMLSRTATIAASTLLVPVAASISTAEVFWQSSPLMTHAWFLWCLLFTYFLLTVPYVKTLIRKRRSNPWLIGSITAHAIAFAVILLLFTRGLVSPWHLLAWAVTLGRAVGMPVSARLRAKPWPPRAIGLPEIALSALIVVTLPY